MPSAANVKIEKQIGSESAAAAAAAAAAATAPPPDNPNASPLRQAITIIEHKIRNLEKRKSKLESYRDLQRSGKDLNQDQKTAVAKYDEVLQTLEFARDLQKQFLSIAGNHEKDEKKRARKEALARSQAELTKVREVLLVQDALTNMGQDSIREDFLNGRNGAATLTQNDLKLLDDLYTVVTPKHEAGDPNGFTAQVQAAAEHLLAVVDGKPKEVFGATYGQIKEVIGKIHESGYLDQVIEPFADDCGALPPTIVEGAGLEPPQQPQMLVNPIEPMPVQQAMENMTLDARQPPQQMAPPQQMVPPPIVEQPVVQPPPPVVQQQQMAPTMEPPVPLQPPVIPEQMYYQQGPPPPQPQPRPIAEVIGTGSFFFLQDSELDTPPEQIPSQTFTNQTYVAAPPPPIPMPPHFQQFPNAPQPVVPQPQPQQPVVPPHANNGIGEPLDDEANRQRGSRHPPNQQQRPGNHPQQQQSGAPQQQQQPYFANNGYRSNRNRNNGPRPNTRHNQ